MARNIGGVKYAPISQRESAIGKSIVSSAFEVHRAPGPGRLEHVYDLCFCHELSKRGLVVRRQVTVPIVYDGISFNHALRLDVLVEELVICELKSVEIMNPVFPAQVLTQADGKAPGLLD